MRKLRKANRNIDKSVEAYVCRCHCTCHCACGCGIFNHNQVNNRNTTATQLVAGARTRATTQAANQIVFNNR